MLVAIIYFYFSLAWRYNVDDLPNTVHTAVIGIEQMAESASFLLVCYYVSKKGSELDTSGNTRKIVRFLRILTLVGIVIFFLLFIYQAIEIYVKSTPAS